MHIQEKISIFYLFHLLLCTVTGSFEGKRPSLMSSYFKLVGTYQEKPSRYLKIDATDYIKYLKEYYESDPLCCLEEVYAMNDKAFDRIFFFVIFYEYSSFFIFPPQNHIVDFFYALINCEQIKKIVWTRFFRPASLNKEVEVNFSVIRLLIRFLARYINTAFSPCPHKEYIEFLSKNFKMWEFAMRTLSSLSPNGAIDYNHFLLIVQQLKKKNLLEFEGYESNDSKYYFLFAIYLQHIIKKRDFNLFQVTHPDLPFIVGLIHSRVDENTNDTFSIYDPANFYDYLDEYLGSETKYEALSTLLDSKAKFISLVKQKLCLKSRRHYSISFLNNLWEEVFPTPQNEENTNIWWQLKGLSLVENFVNIWKSDESE
jgi:hypothetical protein